MEYFEAACITNKVSEVNQMIWKVNVNEENSSGWPTLCEAMTHNLVSITNILLNCPNINIDTTSSHNNQTGLHMACERNSVYCLRVFLAHPTCNKQVVDIIDYVGNTVEMIARQGVLASRPRSLTGPCWRRIRETLSPSTSPAPSTAASR